MPIDWTSVVAKVEPILVKISTPSGLGTGFLLHRAPKTGLIAIATAAHVVSDAHHWEQPIRLTHHRTGTTKLLRHSDRIIRIDESKDVACIIAKTSDFDFNEVALGLFEKGYFTTPGNQIGWLGFPGFYQNSPCFFSGHISCWDGGREFYLVDGVAINGVSGSPAFHRSGQKVEVIGVVSAYWVNRQRGEALPGLSQVADIEWFHEWAQKLQGFEQAREGETPPDPASSPDSSRSKAVEISQQETTGEGVP